MGGIKVEKIKIKNLIFSYPNSKKTALNNINLTVNQGEFVTVCGKSGCGKSTLLRNTKLVLRKCNQSVGRTKTNSQFSVGYGNESDIVVA